MSESPSPLPPSRQSVTVQVEFSPKLKDSSIEEEAKRLAEERLLEEQKQREKALAEEQAKEATSPVPAGVITSILLH